MAEKKAASILSSFLVVFALLPSAMDSAHIYGIPNMNFYSHSRVLWKLGQELVKRGHTYTHVLPDIAVRKNLPGIEIITYRSSITAEQIDSMMSKLAIAGENINVFFKAVFESNNITLATSEDLITDRQIIQTMNNTASLILCDVTTSVCPVIADLVEKPRVDVFPVTAIEPMGSMLYGQPQSLVMMPPLPSLAYLDVSFLARVQKTLTMPLWHYIFFYFMGGHQVWERYGRKSSKSYSSIIRSASMALIQTDFAIEFPRALPAHMKIIGPLLPEPPTFLPREFQTFLDDSTGVLIVSLGTVLKAYGEELIQSLADGFSQLPFKVLWKHGDKKPKRIGDNIRIVPFIPQNDLLAHPKVKVFFTHGGANSFYESIYHAVPMVAMPLFGDQYRSAAIIIEKKIGIVLKKESVTSQDVFKAVSQVLGDPQYADNVKKISDIIKDRKNTPAQEGADWIEYVLRHDGAPHLRNPLIDLWFYEEYMLDVFLFIGCVLVFSLYLSYKMCRFICRKLGCCRSSIAKEKVN